MRSSMGGTVSKDGTTERTTTSSSAYGFADALTLYPYPFMTGGIGFPTGATLKSGGGSGILERLVRDVGGRLSRRNAHGAVVRFVVPVRREDEGRFLDFA